MKTIFICSGNKDRSPALERYYRVTLPEHQFRSAGINKYRCGENNSHYLEQVDLDWADFIVYAEDVHRRKVIEKGFGVVGKKELVLGCGEYDKGGINKEYLIKAEQKLKEHLQ